MKILHIIPSTRAESGGPIRGATSTSEILRSRGHGVDFVSLDAPDAPHVKSFPFTVHAMGPKGKPAGYTPRFVAWIRSNASNYDAAIVHSLWNFGSMGGWLGLRHTDLPYVVFPHGMLDPWFNSVQPLKRLLKQALLHSVQGALLRDARYTLFTNEEEMRLARSAFRMPKYNERTVAFGSSGPVGDPKMQRDVFNACVPDLGGRPFLLFLSRIHPKKGLDLLIEAFGRQRDRLGNLQLVIAGPDESQMRPVMEQIAERHGIAGRLHWAGMLTGDAKWGAFQGCDAFILPSHQENFGIVVAEALSCSKPVLITDKVNIWREVAAAGAGLVAPDTADGIEQQLKAYLDLSEEAKSNMSAVARVLYERQFSVEGAALSLEAVLQEISVR